VLLRLLAEHVKGCCYHVRTQQLPPAGLFIHKAADLAVHASEQSPAVPVSTTLVVSY
jgi:hypothetical protein